MSESLISLTHLFALAARDVSQFKIYVKHTGISVSEAIIEGKKSCISLGFILVLNEQIRQTQTTFILP